MVYLVTWNLNKEGQAYSKARARFLEGIEKFESNYTSILESVRFVSAKSYDANELYDYLKKYIDDNDGLVIVKFEKGTANHQGNLGKELWAWINARI